MTKATYHHVFTEQDTEMDVAGVKFQECLLAVAGAAPATGPEATVAETALYYSPYLSYTEVADDQKIEAAQLGLVNF